MSNPTYKALVEYSPGYFTDISSAVTGFSVSRSISDPVTPMTAGRAIINLLNEDGKFNDSYTENLLTYSEDFAHWSFSAGATQASSSGISPDGLYTLHIISDTSNTVHSDVHLYTGSGSLVGSGMYAASIFVSKDTTPCTSRFSGIIFSFNTNSLTGLGYAQVAFDTQTGSHATETSSVLLLTPNPVIDCGSYWRITLETSFSFPYPYINSYLQVLPAYGAGDPFYTGNRTVTAVGSVGAWGAQINNGCLKNYTPTSGNAITSAFIPIGKALKMQALNKNIFTFSEQFDNVAWVKENTVVTANSGASPENTNAADLLTETSVLGAHTVSQSVSINCATVHSVTLYIKPNGRVKTNLYLFDQAQTSYIKVSFNLTSVTYSGVTASGAGIAIGASISAVQKASGWLRCSLTGLPGVGAVGLVQLRLVNSSDAESYTGDGASGVFLWGAQLEKATIPSNYILTTNTSNPTYDLFTGYLQSVDRDAQYGNRIAVFNCYDLSQKLMRADINSQIFTNYPVSSLATWVASLAGVSSLAAIDAIADVVPYYWADNEPASSAIQKLVNFGHYYAFTDGSGNFNLKDRNSYVGSSAVSSYQEFYGFTVTHDEDKIFNDVTITGQARQLSSSVATVAWLGTPLQIAAGATATFFLQYVDPVVTTEASPATNMQSPVNSSDYTLNTASDGSGFGLTATATASVTFFGGAALCAVYNGGAAGYVTKFQLQGQSIRKTPAIRQTAVDSASQALYGDKQFNLQSDFLYNPNYAAGYASFVVDKYKGAFPQINCGLVKNLFPSVLNTEVGNVLSITNSLMDVGSAYLVRELNHTVDLTNGLEHALQVTLEVIRTGPYIILDDATYGLLDSDRELGF